MPFAPTAVSMPDWLSTGGRAGITPKPSSPLLGLMTIHPDKQDSVNALKRATCAGQQSNFPAMRNLLTDQRCDDDVVLQSVPNRQALGVFHAISTQDGESKARDGQAFYALNRLNSEAGEAVLEIQFDDSLWMLATPSDLEWTNLSASDRAL